MKIEKQIIDILSRHFRTQEEVRDLIIDLQQNIKTRKPLATLLTNLVKIVRG